MTRGPAKSRMCETTRLALVLVLGVVLFTAIGPFVTAFAAPSVTGIVVDGEGSPISGARVSLWSRGAKISSHVAGPDGLFAIEAEAGGTYDVVAFADESSTPGVDYFPVLVSGARPDGDGLVLALQPAASLILEGDIQFVESEELPTAVIYSVLDPASGEIKERDGLPVIYGSGKGSLSQFIELEEYHIVVPADEPFKVGVNCSVLVGAVLSNRIFEVYKPDMLVLGPGEIMTLDVRPYSLRFNLDVSESLLEEVKVKLEEMEALGFYTVREREVAAEAGRSFTEAGFLLDEGRFVVGFDACKVGYIGLRHTKSDLAAMLRDASFSVYVIIAFLALSSTAIAFLLTNRDSTKIVGGVLVYVLNIAILYISYPGSLIVPSIYFAGASVLAILSSLVIALAFPRFMRARGGDSHVPVRNIIVPIFSMAKRSIRRRRLRFFLTLASITVLVMSFVSLTSFSEGYGLISSRVSVSASSRDGVLLRAKGYTEMEPTFLSKRDIDSGWLERQPESMVVSSKAESTPLRRPITKLGDLPITGVLGFDSSKETSITGIEAALREGALPSNGGVAISEELRESLGVNIGDSMWLFGRDFKLVGIFDDQALSSLREFDGSAFLPGKLVNVSPEGEEPQYVLEPCEPSEVVFLHISNALEVSLIGITRVAVTVGGGVDVDAFAERLALERGYWAWSVSSDGVRFARLGSYLEGKGLPLIVPWGIVVLNVVVTMLNSMYERRKEVHILSSVGLNPAQISAIFVAEASIIGLTAGGVGYLAGLGFYRGMGLLGLTLEVRQKVSAFWSLASIGIAMTAVLMGAFAALKSSVVITPSLMRRWRIDDRYKSIWEPYEVVIPVRLLPEEVDEFVDFVAKGLHDLEGGYDRTTSSIKVYGKTEEAERSIEFVYKAVGSIGSNFYTKNFLLVETAANGEVVVRLRAFGEKAWAHVTGSMVRMLAMRWSVY